MKEALQFARLIVIWKELKDSATFASYDKLFHATAPLYLKHLLPESVFGFGREKSVSLFLRS